MKLINALLKFKTGGVIGVGSPPPLRPGEVLVPLEPWKEKAEEALIIELAKPLTPGPRSDGCRYEEDEFDPWRLIPGMYGGYDVLFDKCAIAVLRDVRDQTRNRKDLAADMFREALCIAEFCDYGTSPRVCFWSLNPKLLHRLIVRWTNWAEAKWGPDWPADISIDALARPG